MAHGRERQSHLRWLLKVLDNELKIELSTRNRLRARLGTPNDETIQFSDLWHLFAPGDIIYDPTEEQALQVLQTRGGRAISSTLGSSVAPFFIDCFYLDFDGMSKGPVHRAISITPVKDSLKISELAVSPIDYFRRSQDHGGCRERQEEVFTMLERRGMAHMRYSGPSWGQEQEQIDSEIIVDPELFYQKHPSQAPRLGLGQLEEGDVRELSATFLGPCSCGSKDCEAMKRHNRVYDDRLVDKTLTRKALAGLQASLNVTKMRNGATCHSYHELFPRHFHGFVMKSRSWKLLKVENLSRLEENYDVFRSLFLPPRHKAVVESLVKSHTQTSKGVVMLLHGGHGVGKTYTAECVVKHTGKPLLALTGGDLGETAKEIEENLKNFLSLACRWDCVALLDEADVFMQARDKTDVKRNAIVSVLLRGLDEHSGILFLTTARIGVIDEAFISRIHILLHYNLLDQDQSRSIWEANLDAIRRTTPDIEFSKRYLLEWAKKAWKDNKKDGMIPWNGRQIRNLCLTAATLAKFDDGGELTEQHLDTVAEHSRDFSDYMKELYNADESHRAFKKGLRLDKDDEGDQDIPGARSKRLGRRKPTSSKGTESSNDSEG